MNSFPYNDHAAYRLEQLQSHAANRCVASAVKAQAMRRSAHSLRGALGNGLIALGSKLADPPSAQDFDLDKAA